MISISNTFTQLYHVNCNDMVCEQVVDEWRLFSNWSAARSCSQLYCFGASPSVMSRCRILVPGEGDGRVSSDHVSCVRGTSCPIAIARGKGRWAATICPAVIGSMGDQVLARPLTQPLFGAWERHAVWCVIELSLLMCETLPPHGT